MKVLLVNPPARRFVRCQYPSFPLGLGYVAAALRQAGHEAGIYDAEWGGDFGEPRVALNGLGQFIEAGIDSALPNTVAVGVAVNAGQCAWLADGEHDAVKLMGICRPH